MITYYCGCCGKYQVKGQDLWCMKCLPHITTKFANGSRRPLWEQHYEAIHNKPCPFGFTT